MNILDIDLDFFLDKRIANHVPKKRLSPTKFHPWTCREVEDYLIGRCGLSKERKVSGAVVEYHHELFDIWKYLIDLGRINVPFTLVHIDSHADMGMGDASSGYIMGELLHSNLCARVDPKRDDIEGLCEGNFISFAIACRWIEQIIYVHHPDLRKENLGIHDIPNILFRDCDPGSGVIQLKKLPLGCHADVSRLDKIPPLDLEPEVILNLVECHSFLTDLSFNFIFISKSPNYTPPTSDLILNTIRQFIREISI